jgi:hypothetical protein
LIPEAKVDSSKFDQVWLEMIESGQSLPIWFPVASDEAADVLWRFLQAEKAAFEVPPSQEPFATNLD